MIRRPELESCGLWPARMIVALLAGLALNGLTGAAWGISASMLLYFGYYFWALATWKDIPHEGRDESLA